ncbi:MAG: VOC family protein [Planctomycetota bacterium]|jgi:catechol 2,3-dioxygenase-like lactoylglutathione lyase family enzyme|nr:VOC family protein [Planctomycetota bacterium]MDP7249194.1 VOC family protein [Planctomycetota bacterium]|tara:strand:+ start:96 stop:599 length:504 start_codon:yes stop_codon:yes gene_type:complete
MKMTPKCRLYLSLCAVSISVFLASGCTNPLKFKKKGTTPPPALDAAPGVHHILLEVADVKRALRFYREYLGLKVKSKSGKDAVLRSGNIEIHLWTEKWKFSRGGAADYSARAMGMYPHFKVSDVPATVARMRQGGYRIVMDTIDYGYGQEAFVADADGYVIGVISTK